MFCIVDPVRVMSLVYFVNSIFIPILIFCIADPEHVISVSFVLILPHSTFHLLTSVSNACSFSSASRSLTPLTFQGAWSTSWPATAVTWPSIWRSTRTYRPCGTSGHLRGQSLWSTPLRRISSGRGWTTGRVATGQIGNRGRERNSSTSRSKSRTSGYPWVTSMLIRCRLWDDH